MKERNNNILPIQNPKTIKKFKLSKSELVPMNESLTNIPDNYKLNYNKNEVFYFQKNTLDTLLGLIKQSQLDMLNNIQSKENIKNIMIDLCLSLEDILKDQGITKNYFQKETESKKRLLQQKLFNTVKKNRKAITGEHETLTTEINERDYDAELNQIKLINFKIENEIQQCDFLLKKNKKSKKFLVKVDYIQEDNKEIFCEHSKDISKVERLLHKKVLDLRKTFTETVQKKNIQNDQIITLDSELQNLRKKFSNLKRGYKKYIDTEEVIQEESKDYTKTVLSINTNNNFANYAHSDKYINTNNSNKKIANINQENNFINTIDLQKYLNLNMNINVNIKVNQKYKNDSHNSSIYEGIKEEKDEKPFELKFKNSSNQKVENEPKVFITPIINHNDNINKDKQKDKYLIEKLDDYNNVNLSDEIKREKKKRKLNYK